MPECSGAEAAVRAVQHGKPLSGPEAAVQEPAPQLVRRLLPHLVTPRCKVLVRSDSSQTVTLLMCRGSTPQQRSTCNGHPPRCGCAGLNGAEHLVGMLTGDLLIG